MPDPINCRKLTAADGFCTGSSVSAILNTLDIEMSLGTFASVRSLWKVLPHASAGGADIKKGEIHFSARHITTAPQMIINNDSYINNDDDDNKNNTNDNQHKDQSRQKDLLLGKVIRNILDTSPNPFNPQK